MKEKTEDRIEGISILNRQSGLGIEVLFCNISRKAYFSVSVVDFPLKKKSSAFVSRLLKKDVRIKKEYATVSDKTLTATLVKHPLRFHLILSCPELAFPSGEIGLKTELTLSSFESSTFTKEEDGWQFSHISPLYATGAVFIDHRNVPLSRDNGLGCFSSLSGDFRGKAISVAACPFADTGDKFWGYVSMGGDSLLLRDGQSAKAKLKEDLLFEEREKVPKGFLASTYCRYSGSFAQEKGARGSLKPSYGFRKSFSI